MENERKLPHDRVLRVTEIAQAAVVAHAEAHGVSRQEAADSLILTGAAAEQALVEALEADAPDAPAGELRDRDRTFVALSEEALGVVDSWTIQGGHPDRASATSDLVVRAGRRLASLVAWRKKQPSRSKKQRLGVDLGPKKPPEFYVPGETWDQAEFERIGRIRESDIGPHWVAVDNGGGRWAKLGDGTTIRVFNQKLRDARIAGRGPLERAVERNAALRGKGAQQ